MSNKQETRHSKSLLSQTPLFYAVCAGATTLGLTTLYFLNQWRAKPSRDFPMSDGYLPIIGHTRMLQKHAHVDMHDWRMEQLEKHGDSGIVVESLPGTVSQVHWIVDPKLVHYVHEEKFDHITRGAVNRMQFQELFGNGIFNADKENWKKHRKIASRLLTMRNLKYGMFEKFDDVSKRLCAKLMTMKDNEDPIDLGELFLRMTMDGFVSSAFGVDSNNIEDDNSTEFCRNFTQLFLLLIPRFSTRPWWKWTKMFDIGEEAEIRRLTKYIRNFCNDVVQKNQRRRDLGDINEASDLLSIFMKFYDGITLEEIQDVCINFIIAGRDTTGMLLSWFVFEMMMHPDIYQNVLAELKTVEELTYETVAKLTYTESCLLETLRLHAVVPNTNGMDVIKDIVLPDGRVIPQGSRVAVHAYTMGRSERLHERPLEFDPSRFSKGLSSMKPNVFPHFSVAPRVCLGRTVSLMEAKTCVWYLFQTFDIEKAFDGPLRYNGPSLLFAKNLFVRVHPKPSSVIS